MTNTGQQDTCWKALEHWICSLAAGNLSRYTVKKPKLGLGVELNGRALPSMHKVLNAIPSTAKIFKCFY
jgi:hypothetical protein